ncbi:MAG TPA: TraR/DksA C4-type zinc finger protein [Acidimicrobiales bacterium]|nr:TraR/DksA C4-type zinc finger protein [Acidimicrobiales bacterium]
MDDDAATDAFQREKEFSILDGVDADLADVDRALERLAGGSYGTCDACGQPIGDERLAVAPAAQRCDAHRGGDGPGGDETRTGSAA